MYHKKLDKPTETLAEWTKNCNEKKKTHEVKKIKKQFLLINLTGINQNISH